MPTNPWFADVRYYDVTPTTIQYEMELDAFYIARADIRSPLHPYRLGLAVTVTIRDLAVNRLTVDEAIKSGRVLLDGLIVQHRTDVDSLRAHSLRVFDFAGTRLR
jgi:hypothetical protein